MKRISTRRRRVKLSGDELLRRLRLGDLRKLFADRCRRRVLPDDDAGREYLRELLLPISLGPNDAVRRPGAIQIWGPVDRMRREIESWAPWLSEDETQDVLDEINLMPMWQRKPMAATLGDRLGLTYAERSRLRIQTIGACDMSEAAMALIRKQKKRRRDRLRRQARGAKSRAEYLAANNKSREKPWVVRGISRRAYYYQIKRERDCTGPRRVNLSKTELALVQSEVCEAVSKECSRDAAPTPAWQTGTCVEWESIWAEEMAWMPNSMAEAA